MNLVAGKSALVKLLIVAAIAGLVTIAGLLGNSQKVLASAFGPSASHTNAPGESNCASCHASFEVNSGSGSIQISGVPQTYTPGQQIAVTITTSQEDAVIYGFQMTAIDSLGQTVGSFTLPSQNPARTQVVPGNVGGRDRQYVEHTSDGLSNGQFGFNSWTFMWTAPPQSAGRVDFYAAGNAANSDGGTSGDYIYTATTASLPASGPLVSISGKVFTSSGLALRNARVILTDPDNVQRISITSSFGVYSFADVPSGVTYTLSAQSKRYRFAAKILSVTDNLTNVDFTGLE